MTWYKLYFGGTEFGDELILTSGFWKSTLTASHGKSGEVITSLNDVGLAIGLYPRFRIRKTFENQWQFERWIYDLAAWADGERRPLYVIDNEQNVVACYGECKLLELERTVPQGAQSGRWSDEVVLTFQADALPEYSTL
jgi:hypothetical protein